MILFPTPLSLFVPQDTVFVQKPYLQLGNHPTLSKSESLVLLWQTGDSDAAWSVEVKATKDARWRPVAPPTFRRIAVATVEAHRVYTAALTGLVPGEKFLYRVLREAKVVFQAEGLARKSAQQPQRFVVFGDCGQNNAPQKKVAYQTYLQKPDFVFITGDIVYSNGRISEYQKNYFPIYNADKPDPAVGAPLSRSTVFLASPGNHDILNRDLTKFPDGLGYFLYWDQPLNGPLGTVGAANTPTLSGSDENQKAFLTGAGSAYPRMANFSFDCGNAHWTVLDADPYVDWNDKALRDWVAKDLAAAKNATWRFVGFHQPGFNSSKSHFGEQYMRVLSDVFEKGRVDIVFNGHVHNYQRSFPLTFIPTPGQPAKGMIAGQWVLDKSFDGKTKTRPQGVIYLVTGAGGAGLYNPEQQDKPDTLQAFTDKYIANIHSFTVVEINGKQMLIKQLDEDGKELDRFTITK